MQAQAGKPTVVAVDGVLCDLTRTLAGSSASVICLIPAGADPHTFRFRGSDRRALSRADLVLHNGFKLSPAAMKLEGNPKVVAVAELAMPNYDGADPHVWHDPANTAAMAEVVTARLQSVLPASEHAGLQARGRKANAVLSQLGSWGGSQFGTLAQPQRVLVSEHQAYSHLADRYDITQITMLDSFTSKGVLRPSSLRAITSAVKASGAKTLFPESLPANKTLRRISRSTGIPVNDTPLYPEGLGPDRSTVSTATWNICTVVKGQGGQCDQTKADALESQWDAIR
ncbi:metal ABC transporter substrate-binding protein [Synechococcus sp. RSCCF101]|uniref:metal ABC transporter substrate-binding protein n=1 Tax=Synechococcus sp. RSCCF101 TaxID=2511069 RepID=UPI001CD962B5|nr:metal ABC transporter substrate-binding protein [Synechococcus sp. RSCCF101]